MDPAQQVTAPGPLHDTIKSKKLWFSAGSIVTMFVFPLVSCRFPQLGPMYDTFVGGVVAVSGLYLTGNIANKWVVGKSGAIVSGIQSQKQGLQQVNPELDDSPVRENE